MATKLTKHITFGDVSSDIPNGFPLIVRLTTSQYSQNTPNLNDNITGYDGITYYDTFLNKTIQYSDFKTEVQRNRPVLLNWTFALSSGDTTLTLPLNYQTLSTPTLKFEYKGIINNVATDAWATSTSPWKSYNCIISLNCTGSTPVFNYKKIEQATNKPIIIKPNAITGDPAVGDILTLNISSSVDMVNYEGVATNQLFTKGTAGRRLVVYIQGAGSVLTPCEIFPIRTGSTIDLFSGFVGMKFRGGTNNNYYGFYVKLASDGTLTATVEDRQVYS